MSWMLIAILGMNLHCLDRQTYQAPVFCGELEQTHYTLIRITPDEASTEHMKPLRLEYLEQEWGVADGL